MSDITYKLEREIDWFISNILAGLLNGITKEEEQEALKYLKDYYPIGINLVGNVEDWMEINRENREDEDEDDWNYKNGKKEGLRTVWFKNGQKKLEEDYKDGKEEGVSTRWYESGQKELEGNYKNGKLDGLLTNWYENGQKEAEGNYRNGKEDGLVTYWYENGQKRMEGNWKNGEFVKTLTI